MLTYISNGLHNYQLYHHPSKSDKNLIFKNLIFKILNIYDILYVFYIIHITWII